MDYDEMIAETDRNIQKIVDCADYSDDFEEFRACIKDITL